MSRLAIDQVLAQIRALSSQAPKPHAPAGPSATKEAPGFASFLKQGVGQVNAAQQRAAEVATQFERGVPGVELSQVMLELQKASVVFAPRRKCATGQCVQEYVHADLRMIE